MAEPGDPHQPDPDPVVTPEPEPPAVPPPVDVETPAGPDPEPVAEPEPEPEPEPELEPEPEPEPEPAPVRPRAALHDDDALVGFASAAALVGQARPVEPEPDPMPDSEPVPDVAPAPETVVIAPAVESGSTFALTESFSRRRKAPPAVDGSTGLFTVYALILFALPTFGVSAVLGLLAVTGKPLPDDAVARSHLIFQQRTLWAAAVVAVLGAILIVVGVGVFILFALALWLPLRGAAGLWQLKAGRAVANPRSWLI